MPEFLKKFILWLEMLVNDRSLSATDWDKDIELNSMMDSLINSEREDRDFEGKI